MFVCSTFKQVGYVLKKLIRATNKHTKAPTLGFSALWDFFR